MTDTINVLVRGQNNLLEVVGTLDASRHGADLLDSRQQQADQHGYDGNHHQQLDESEGRTPLTATCKSLHGSDPQKKEQREPIPQEWENYWRVEILLPFTPSGQGQVFLGLSLNLAKEKRMTRTLSDWRV